MILNAAPYIYILVLRGTGAVSQCPRVPRIFHKVVAGLHMPSPQVQECHTCASYAAWSWCMAASGTVAPTGEPEAGDRPPVAGDTLPPPGDTAPGDVGLYGRNTYVS